MGFKVISIGRRVFFCFHFEGFLHFQSPRMLSDTGILWVFWGVCCCLLFPAHIHFTEEAAVALIEVQPLGDGPTMPKEQGAH